MLEYRPFVPISHGVRVSTAILSYNGHLAFGITGDYDTAPDVDVLARGIEDGVAELVKLSHHRPDRRTKRPVTHAAGGVGIDLRGAQCERRRCRAEAASSP